MAQERTGTAVEVDEVAVSEDQVRLAVPATPEFLRLARVTATGLASRLGFTFDEVEDLRLAIDELCFALIGTKGRSGTVQLKYLIREGALEVEGTGAFDDRLPEGAGVTVSELSERILDALVDEHEVKPNGERPTFRLLKRHLGA